MVTDTYAEIFDSRRKVNTKKFDNLFFDKEECGMSSDKEIAAAISSLLRSSKDTKKVLQQADLEAIMQ